MTTESVAETAAVSESAPGAPTWRRVVQGVVSLGIVVGIFVGVMPRIADYGDVWATVRLLTWREATVLAVIALCNLATYWFVLVAALPGLRLTEAAVVNQASTAVANTLPGGGAVGVAVTVAMLTSWGFTVTDIARSSVVTGIWNNFVKLGMPVAALALLAVEGGVTLARVAAAAVGVAALAAAIVGFGLVMRREGAARRIGAAIGTVVNWVRRMVRRPPQGGWGERAARLRRDTAGFVRNRWVALTTASVVSHVSLYLVLLAALRHVGVGEPDLSSIQVLAAFAFVRLISALPVTPGGVGVVELGYTAALTIGLEAAARAQVVAAVLLFRAITYVVPIPLGAASYVVWRRNRSWRLSREQRAALTGRVYDVSPT